MPRRIFSKDFKAAALRRLESGASPIEVARACNVSPGLLHRWRREVGQFGEKAFGGYGNSRSEVMPRTRAVVFRLTPEEFDSLKHATFQGGARSISDFARTRVLSGAGQPSLAQLEQKLDQLTLVVQQLAEMVTRS